MPCLAPSVNALLHGPSHFRTSRSYLHWSSAHGSGEQFGSELTLDPLNLQGQGPLFGA